MTVRKIPVKRYQANLTCLFFLFLVLCSGMTDGYCQERIDREKIIASMSGRIPKEWGERVSGVKTRLASDRKIIALTFDACGSRKSSSYDDKLIAYLEEEKIPATLFISGGWIDANLEIAKKLAGNPLFDIENHGLNHKPCSSTGRSAYGIEGTKDVGEMFDEIDQNATKIETLTGRRPKYYRPAASYSDEICVEVANALGHEVVNFSLSGDGGATFKKSQVKEALLSAPSSSIVLLHMNRPDRETAAGVMEVVPELKKRGFGFVKLSDHSLR